MAVHRRASEGTMTRVVRAVMVEGQAIFDAGAVDEVVAVLREGGLVVYPTDTLYGLGADVVNPDAVARVFSVKQRASGLPVSIAVANLDAAKEFAVVTPRAEALCRRWLPGPLTLIFPPTAEAPKSVLSKEGMIAIRVPNHAVALLLARQFGPITATSANLHGKPSPVETWQAAEQLGDAVDLYLDAGPCPVGRESTVVDLTGTEPRLVREGAVPWQSLGLPRTG